MGKISPIALRLSSVCAVALLTACSGGGASGSGPQTAHPALSSSVQFIVTVPAKTAQGSARTRQYISPATQSLAITTDGAGSPTIANLTPTSSQCSASGGALTCTASTDVQPGSHTFTLVAYDAPNGTGNKLSQTTTASTKINPGIVNTVPVTLGGVIASFAVGLSNAAPITGTAATITVTATAKDAAGNIIIGADPYASTVTLTDSDGSGATTLSTSNIISPSTGVTIQYNGSPSLVSATISATIPGVAPSAITSAVLKPVSVSSGGSEAIVVVPKGGTTFAIVPADGGVAVVDIASGNTLEGIKRSEFAAAQKSETIDYSHFNQRTAETQLRAKRSAIRRTADTAAGTTPLVIPVSPQPDECAADYAALTAFCINYGSNTVTKIDLASFTQTGSYVTDAGQLGGIEFSGATCTICGIVYDPQDSAYVISSSNGYELLKETDGTLVKTIPHYVAENFGYNPITNQILSPEYGYSSSGSGSLPDISLIDIASGTGYTAASSPPGLYEPDAGAVDPTTNIGIMPEEYAHSVYLVSLDKVPLTPPTTPGTNGTFSAAISNTVLSNEFGGFNDDFAVDGASHLAFLASEFGYAGPIAVIALPTTKTSTPVPGDYVFAQLPPTPDGATFVLPGDPHATATYNLGGTPLGLTFNADDTYVAVINMTKLLNAPRSSSDPHAVDPTYDLIANGVIYYDAI